MFCFFIFFYIFSVFSSHPYSFPSLIKLLWRQRPSQFSNISWAQVILYLLHTFVCVFSSSSFATAFPSDLPPYTSYCISTFVATDKFAIHGVHNTIAEIVTMPRPSRNHVSVYLYVYLFVCVICLDAMLCVVFGHVYSYFCLCVCVWMFCELLFHNMYSFLHYKVHH